MLLSSTSPCQLISRVASRRLKDLHVLVLLSIDQRSWALFIRRYIICTSSFSRPPGSSWRTASTFLLRPRKRWRSIVISTPVCLPVRQDISGTTRAIFTNFSVHVAYGRGSVLFQQGGEIPRGRGSFGGFLPHEQCIVQHSIWDSYKNG